jgi:hypothetical protein
MRSALLRSVFAATLLIGIALGCNAETEVQEPNESDLSARCTQGSLLYKVKQEFKTEATQSGAPKFYEQVDDIDASLSGGRLPTATVVSRLQLRNSDRGIFSKVEVLTGPHRGSKVWLASNALEPYSGGCEAVLAQNASVVERIAFRGDSLPAELGEATLQCALGVSEGVLGGVGGLVSGIPQLVGLAASSIAEVIRRDRDIILMGFGSEEAERRLANAGSDDRDRVLAALSMVGHILPAVHTYITEQHKYYQLMDGPHQSKFLCGVIGRVGFEVAVALVPSSKASKVAEAKALAEQAVEKAIAAHLLVAEIPGRVGTANLLSVNTAVRSLRNDSWVSSRVTVEQAKEYGIDFQTVYEQLLKTKDPARRKYLIAALNDTTNPIHRLGWIKSGNCSMQAHAALFMLATGNAMCALGELYGQSGRGIGGAEIDNFDPAIIKGLRDAGAKIDDTMPIGNAAALLAHAEKIPEGGLAYLFSKSGGKGGHATVVTRLNGELVHINNQSWNKIRAADDIIALSQWTQQWANWVSKAGGTEATYKLVLTKLAIPFAP